MPPGPLVVPPLSYDQLRGAAAAFLAEHHPVGTIPVPVEEIIELRLGLDIIPMPGLYRNFDIDAFVSRDLRAISVDEDAQARRPERYRDSLAHELAHVLIHADVIAQLDFATIAGWKAAVTGIDVATRAIYEGQARDLGSLILVPPAALRAEFDLVEAKLAGAGMSLEAAFEAGKNTIEANLARVFSVPRPVIATRTYRDKLWPA